MATPEELEERVRVLESMGESFAQRLERLERERELARSLGVLPPQRPRTAADVQAERDAVKRRQAEELADERQAQARAAQEAAEAKADELNKINGERRRQLEEHQARMAAKFNTDGTPKGEAETPATPAGGK